MKDYWGGMLDLGATTFWEDFDVDWLKNAARIDELTPAGKIDVHRTYGDLLLQGIPSQPGPRLGIGSDRFPERVRARRADRRARAAKVVRVEPHLGDLEWVEGTVPTPYGVIRGPS